MTDKTPLGKLIVRIEGDIKACEDSGVNVLFVAALRNCLTKIKSLLPEEKQAIEDAIKSEAAREYWEGQGRHSPHHLTNKYYSI